jgi:hypothetical protein
MAPQLLPGHAPKGHITICHIGTALVQDNPRQRIMRQHRYAPSHLSVFAADSTLVTGKSLSVPYPFPVSSLLFRNTARASLNLHALQIYVNRRAAAFLATDYVL